MVRVGVALLTGPAGGILKVVQLVYKGIQWLLANSKLVLCIIQGVFRILQAAGAISSDWAACQGVPQVTLSGSETPHGRAAL